MSDSSQRDVHQCSNCKQFMSPSDAHVTCFRCRGLSEFSVCSRTSPCGECSPWTDEQWAGFSKAVKRAKTKAERAENRPPTTPVPGDQPRAEPGISTEDLKMFQLFSRFYKEARASDQVNLAENQPPGVSAETVFTRGSPSPNRSQIAPYLQGPTGDASSSSSAYESPPQLSCYESGTATKRVRLQPANGKPRSRSRHQSRGRGRDHDRRDGRQHTDSRDSRDRVNNHGRDGFHTDYRGPGHYYRHRESRSRDRAVRRRNRDRSRSGSRGRSRARHHEDHRDRHGRSHQWQHHSRVEDRGRHRNRHGNLQDRGSTDRFYEHRRQHPVRHEQERHVSVLSPSSNPPSEAEINSMAVTTVQNETLDGNTVSISSPSRSQAQDQVSAQTSVHLPADKDKVTDDKEEELEPSFRDVIGWVRDFFKMESTSGKNYDFQGSTGDRATRQPKTDPLLLQAAKVFTEEDSFIREGIRGKTALFKKEPKPYPKSSFLPDPPYSKAAYKVDGLHHQHTSQLPPGNWQSLAKSGSSKRDHAVKFSETEIKLQESHLAKMRSILNLTDWATGFVVQNLGDLASDPTKANSETLTQLLRVSRTIARSTSHLQRETIHLHANTVLRRRDSFLEDLPDAVSQDDRILLRSSSFLGEHLFDQDTVGSAVTRSDAAIVRSANLEVVQAAKTTRPILKNKSTKHKQSGASGFNFKPQKHQQASTSTDRADDGRKTETSAKFSGRGFSGKSSARGRGRGQSHKFSK